MLKYRRAFSKEIKTMMPLRSPANKSNPDLGNVEVINALRGVVALAVMRFHFTRPCDLPRNYFHQTIPCTNT